MYAMGLLRDGEALTQLGPFYGTNYETLNRGRNPLVHRALYQIYVSLFKLRTNCYRSYRRRLSAAAYGRQDGPHTKSAGERDSLIFDMSNGSGDTIK